MVEFVCSWCTLWFCLCVLCSLFLSLSCRIVVVLCPSLPPSSPSSLWPSKPVTPGDHGDGVALPPSFLFSSVSPLTLRASSHIHLPLLCLCLSILWCDPRRHGLTKLDELRSVPSSSSPSFCLTQPLFLLPLLYFYSLFTSSWLALSHPPPFISVVVSFPLRSHPLSCAVCTCNCSVDDASGFLAILHYSCFVVDRRSMFTVHRSMIMVMPLWFLCSRSCHETLCYFLPKKTPYCQLATYLRHICLENETDIQATKFCIWFHQFRTLAGPFITSSLPCYPCRFLEIVVPAKLWQKKRDIT